MYHKYGIGNAQIFFNWKPDRKKKHVGSLGTDVKRKFQGIVHRQGVDEMVEEAKEKDMCSESESTRIIEN